MRSREALPRKGRVQEAVAARRGARAGEGKALSVSMAKEIEEAVRRSPPGLRSAIRRRLTPHLERQRRLERGLERPVTPEEVDELFC